MLELKWINIAFCCQLKFIKSYLTLRFLNSTQFNNFFAVLLFSFAVLLDLFLAKVASLNKNSEMKD